MASYRTVRLTVPLLTKFRSISIWLGYHIFAFCQTEEKKQQQIKLQNHVQSNCKNTHSCIKENQTQTRSVCITRHMSHTTHTSYLVGNIDDAGFAHHPTQIRDTPFIRFRDSWRMSKEDDRQRERSRIWTPCNNGQNIATQTRTVAICGPLRQKGNKVSVRSFRVIDTNRKSAIKEL